MSRLNRHLWQRFTSLTVPYWFSEEKWRARGLLILLILLLLGKSASNVLFNEQSGEFTSSLAAKDAERFWRSIYQCIVLLVVSVPIWALFFYVRDRLAIYWRRWMTDRLLDRYFSHRAYFELTADANIDNPDQRIAEDINTFTQKSLEFVLVVLGALIQLVAFCGVLWTISHRLTYFLVIYAVVGTLVTVVLFGRVLVGLNFLQLKKEADLRFGLVRIRENAEAIAFYQGERQELSQVKGRFQQAFLNFKKLILWQLNLNVFQYSYTFLTYFIPFAIVAHRVLAGELEVGRAVEAGGAFMAILTALAVIVDNFDQLSRFAAGINRLDTFTKALSADIDSCAKSDVRIEFVEDGRLELQDITLQTPDSSRVIVQNLLVRVDPGRGLMIVGPSGCGKSSLLRAMAGLWDCGYGTIIRPPLADMMFLPQRPYMIMGSLRSQLLYPNMHRDVADSELADLLARVNLPYLAQRFGGLDAEVDWGKVLSIGEQQRVALARVLIAHPRYAMLDEATSALDPGNEEFFYRQLIATSTTVVSVSHHANLLKFHHQVLELSGDDSSWEVHLARGFSFRS
jgi:vitamin B12/bleomycin/antimicrobial peptide transport system ATP-binding/permease protein